MRQISKNEGRFFLYKLGSIRNVYLCDSENKDHLFMNERWMFTNEDGVLEEGSPELEGIAFQKNDENLYPLEPDDPKIEIYKKNYVAN